MIIRAEWFPGYQYFLGSIGGIPIVAIYYFAFFAFLMYQVFSYFTNKTRYGKYLYERFGIILIGGKFNSGKTRLLSQFAKDVSEKENSFVISNFYNGYNFVGWSSLEDFVNILEDLLILGEYQNFTESEKIRIGSQFGGYFTMDLRKFRKKYPNIPRDGSICNFLVEGDEFHQYLYGRNSMANFSGETGQKLLQTLHQVRHYNTLLVLSTQDIEELDNKLRRLAAYEIDTMHFFNLFFGYNFFHYFINNRKTKEKENEREFHKVNKFPILFFNGYSANFIIKDAEIRWNKLENWAIRKWNRIMQKNVIFRKRVFPRFKTLDFETKFNVKITESIYEKWSIFDRLEKFYREKNSEKPERIARETTGKIPGKSR